MVLQRLALKFYLCLTTSLVGAAALEGIAHAQSMVPTEGARSEIEEIIVTARKRQETIQNVPASIQAINSAQIDRAGIDNIESIATVAPQLVVARAPFGSGASFTLRGIGSTFVSIGIEQSVATVLDGVYYGQGRVINDAFTDLARIEVMKGPQALFYGKNASAGVISLVTADPTDQTEIRLRTGYEFNAQEVMAEAILSGPVTENLGLRLAISGSKMFSGYFDNFATNTTLLTRDVATGVTTAHTALPAKDGDRRRHIFARLTAKWTPTDRLDWTFKINAGIDKNDNPGANFVTYLCRNGVAQRNPAFPCGKRFAASYSNLPADMASGVSFSKGGELFNDYKSGAATSAINYDLDAVKLTLVTNYQALKDDYLGNFDFEQTPNVRIFNVGRARWRAFSTEGRAVTSYDGPINALVGVLYQKSKLKFSEFNVNDATVLPENSAAADPTKRYLARDKDSETAGETISGFGQVIWNVVPKMELAAGVRYTHETKDSYFVHRYVNPRLAGTFPPNVFLRSDQTFTNWSPEVTLSYRPQTGVNIYGAYKTGYKSGGFSNSAVRTAFTQLNDLAFGPETVKGFEGGVKTSLYNNLKFNVGLYTYKYSGLQIEYFNAILIANKTTNVGAALTKGVEIETQWAPRGVPGLMLSGTVNYNKAVYKNFLGPCYAGQGIPQGCNTIPGQGQFQDLSGKSLANAPRWTATLGLNYHTDLSSDLVFETNVSTRYSGSYLTTNAAIPNSRQRRYALLDMTVAMRARDERWEVAVVGNNLTNHFVNTGTYEVPFTGAGTATANGVPADLAGLIANPRTVQLRLTHRF